MEEEEEEDEEEEHKQVHIHTGIPFVPPLVYNILSYRQYRLQIPKIDDVRAACTVQVSSSEVQRAGYSLGWLRCICLWHHC